MQQQSPRIAVQWLNIENLNPQNVSNDLEQSMD